MLEPVTRGSAARSIVGLAWLSGCASLGFTGAVPAGTNGSDPVPPEVRVAEVRLADAPTNGELAAYYCAQIAPAFVCRVFGPVRRAEEMRFVFDVALEIENRNAVPLPVVSALFAFTAYPDEDERSLGTACVQLCGECEPDADACRSETPEIRDVDDFANAATGFLIDVARGERRFEDLRVRTVPAGDRIRLVTQLELDAEQTVALVRRMARETVEQVRRGEEATFAIPYRLEGSVWVEVESFGRFAATFPPHDGEWELPR